VDLWRLRTAVAATAAAVGTTERQAALRTVIGLGHVELAAGKAWPWLGEPRESVHRDVLDAYLGLIDSSPPGHTTDLLRQALRYDPLNEDVALRAMRSLAGTGDLTAVAAVRDGHIRRRRHAGLPAAPKVVELADHLAAAPHDQR
jgi:hypothetical protein